MFVAYREGKKIQNQPSIGSVIKYQDLSSGKSEPRDPGVIVLMRQYFIGISKKESQGSLVLAEMNSLMNDSLCL